MVKRESVDEYADGERWMMNDNATMQRGRESGSEVKRKGEKCNARMQKRTMTMTMMICD